MKHILSIVRSTVSNILNNKRLLITNLGSQKRFTSVIIDNYTITLKNVGI